jgi:elongation factor P--beta-lysine ligase
MKKEPGYGLIHTPQYRISKYIRVHLDPPSLLAPVVDLYNLVIVNTSVTRTTYSNAGDDVLESESLSIGND